MIVGIHQLNFAPWLGYFNKIYKSDLFILMDEVQITFSETMNRNRILNKYGAISFLSIPCVKKDYLNKKFYEIEISDAFDWQERFKCVLKDSFSKSKYFYEIFDLLKPIFDKKYKYVIDVNFDLLNILLDLLGIKTKIIKQSSLTYDRSKKKNDLVIELCKAVNADIYLSGNGAKDYMDISSFNACGIDVMFQTFRHPSYEQFNSVKEFVPGLSILDVLFSIGIEETKKLFFANICKEEEICKN